MRRINFTEDDVTVLKDLSQKHPHPKVRLRALTLLLKSFSMPHKTIAEIIDCSENTVRTYFEIFSEEGIEGLKKINIYCPEPKLKPFESVVREYIDKTPPTHIAKACADIEKLTKVSIKPTQMRVYLKSIGVKCRKVASIPAKADPKAQKEFHDEQLQPRLDEAKVGKREVYFVDAAHFVLGAFLGWIWSFVREYVRTPAGRQRFNVLGALNAVSKHLITITNDTYITSIEVCDLLRKIKKEAKKPVTLVLDNARYQRCKLVTTLAMELNIELLFLPPYSPNLNLIERLWKLVKKECLYSIYYDNFLGFKNSISGFLKDMNQTHQEKLDSLLTLKFHLFTDEQIRKAH